MTVQWQALVALVVLTVVVGLVHRSRQGRLRLHGSVLAVPNAWGADLAALGTAPGARATFLQFSTAVCTPCRATARTLGALAEAEEDVEHIEVDVDEHVNLVLRAGVLRAPTVLVLDAAGTEVARASGAMTPAQARAALDAVTSDSLPSGRNA
ncbi:TlpA family protein disulfide reductase [Isoptericola croceus]|uniref:TlpA family protein disulfide reductase n=1 Tax=Isoptericola croceus TaxID=3031406 RepID=UPI0023F69644|nr:thioredoxin family protein [Isoptericola croceus]